MEPCIVVDSGTTTTRARLYVDGRVTQSVSEPVGARNTATDGNNAALKAGLTNLLTRLRETGGAEARNAEAVVCSGMITSNMGLLEVPHLTAPANVEALAEQVLRHDFPDVTPLPIYFVRGVKTLGERLEECDVLRGEEVECLGLRNRLSLSGPAVFMHYGSHSKAIDTDENGTILRSRTGMTGELLATIVRHTILASSVVSLDDLEIDDDVWRDGLDAAQRHGVGRALFLVRVGEQIAGRSNAAMTSFLLGVLASLDLPLLEGALGGESTVVLYGRGEQKEAVGRYLHAHTSCNVMIATDEEADLAAAQGAVTLYRRHRELTERDGGARP